MGAHPPRLTPVPLSLPLQSGPQNFRFFLNCLWPVFPPIRYSPLKGCSLSHAVTRAASWRAQVDQPSIGSIKLFEVQVSESTRPRVGARSPDGLVGQRVPRRAHPTVTLAFWVRFPSGGPSCRFPIKAHSSSFQGSILRSLLVGQAASTSRRLASAFLANGDPLPSGVPSYEAKQMQEPTLSPGS